MKPSYAHVPDPDAGGVCGECVHSRYVPKTGREKAFTYCFKAADLARHAGTGLPIKPETQGCKYWQFKGRVDPS